MNEERTLEPLILIDASNLIYRMYYTYINLSNSKGIMTGAIFGFFDMIINYVDKLQIKNVVLVWDTPSEYNWRLNLYPDYKKRRRIKNITDTKKIEIKKNVIENQIKIYELSKLLGFINIKKMAYEADDLAGMLLKIYRSEVRIITMDKDYLQFVNDRRKVRVYRPGIGRGSYKVYNDTEVKNEFFVEPRQIVNLLAIAGDDGDDVPGIGGYAYKKAAAIINENKYSTFTEQQKSDYERNLILVDLFKVPGDLKLKDIEFNFPKFVEAQKILDELEIKKYMSVDFSRINTREFKLHFMKEFL